VQEDHDPEDHHGTPGGPAGQRNIEFLEKRIDGKDAEEIGSPGNFLCAGGREVFPELSVDENLKMGAYIRRDKKGVKEDYDRVITHFPHSQPEEDSVGGTLSGGEQQNARHWQSIDDQA